MQPSVPAQASHTPKPAHVDNKVIFNSSCNGEYAPTLASAAETVLRRFGGCSRASTEETARATHIRVTNTSRTIVTRSNKGAESELGGSTNEIWRFGRLRPRSTTSKTSKTTSNTTLMLLHLHPHCRHSLRPGEKAPTIKSHTTAHLDWRCHRRRIGKVQQRPQARKGRCFLSQPQKSVVVEEAEEVSQSGLHES